MDEEEGGHPVSIVRVIVGTILLGIVLVFVVDLLEGPFFSFSARMWPPEVRGGKVFAGVQGPLKAADVSAGTVSVASGFLGLGSLPLVITPNTQIAVRGKLGGMADLDRGQFVRIAYEVLPDRLLAWRVDVLDGSSQAAELPLPAETIETVADDTAGVSTPPPSPAPPHPRPAEAGVMPSTPPAVAAPPTTVPTAPSTHGATALPVAKRSGGTPAPAPRRSAVPPPPAVSPTPSANQLEDGGAAVDWLFKQSSSRGQ